MSHTIPEMLVRLRAHDNMKPAEIYMGARISKNTYYGCFNGSQATPVIEEKIREFYRKHHKTDITDL